MRLPSELLCDPLRLRCHKLILLRRWHLVGLCKAKRSQHPDIPGDRPCPLGVNVDHQVVVEVICLAPLPCIARKNIHHLLAHPRREAA